MRDICFASEEQVAWNLICEHLTPKEQAPLMSVCRDARATLGRAKLPYVSDAQHEELKRFYGNDRELVDDDPVRIHYGEYRDHRDNWPLFFELNQIALRSKSPALIRFLACDVGEWEMLLADALIAGDMQVCDYITRLVKPSEVYGVGDIDDENSREILKKYNIREPIYNIVNSAKNMLRISAGDIITTDISSGINLDALAAADDIDVEYLMAPSCHIVNYLGPDFLYASYVLAATRKNEAGINELRATLAGINYMSARACIAEIINARDWPADVIEFLMSIGEIS